VCSADAVVAITDAMVHQYRLWGVRRQDVHVIPNWAPLDEIMPGDRDNRWAKQHELPRDAVRLMYAGTLGRKHNPLLLLALLDAVKARGINAYLVVVSEGVGADDLRLASTGRDDVKILGFQPAEDMSDVLASADAVVTLLEPDAAQFSVPSKVLTYLAAGCAVVALAPKGNPAAKDVSSVGGFVGEPTVAGAQAAAAWLEQKTTEPEGLANVGHHARALAAARFDIDRITDSFESIFEQVAYRGSAETWPIVVTARDSATI
jgi:glycosyltransferase involved in cell wall biosynthesis